MKDLLKQLIDIDTIIVIALSTFGIIMLYKNQYTEAGIIIGIFATYLRNRSRGNSPQP